MKKVLPVSFLLLASLLTACNGWIFSNKFSVKGELDGYNAEYIYCAYEKYKEGIVFDTTKVLFGNFILRADIEEETPLYLFDNNNNIITVLLAKNGEKVKINGNFVPYRLKISGSEPNTFIGEFYNNNASVLQRLDSLRALFPVNYTDSSYLKKLQTTTNRVKALASDFVKTHRTSTASIFILSRYVASNSNREETRHLISIIAPEAKPVVMSARIEKFAALQKYDKGKIMPYAQVISDKDSSLFSFNIKNILTVVSFWSATDSSCRASLKELRKIYNKYPSAKLKVHSISVDTDKKLWLNVLKEEAMPWPQSILPEGWNSQTVKLLNITSIPSVFLIEKNGVIIGRDLMPDSLYILIDKAIAHNDSIKTIISDKVKKR